MSFDWHSLELTQYTQWLISWVVCQRCGVTWWWLTVKGNVGRKLHVLTVCEQVFSRWTNFLPKLKNTHISSRILWWTRPLWYQAGEEHGWMDTAYFNMSWTNPISHQPQIWSYFCYYAVNSYVQHWWCNNSWNSPHRHGCSPRGDDRPPSVNKSQRADEKRSRRLRCAYVSIP